MDNLEIKFIPSKNMDIIFPLLQELNSFTKEDILKQRLLEMFEQNYKCDLAMHVLDASRAVVVVQKLINPEIKSGDFHFHLLIFYVRHSILKNEFAIKSTFVGLYLLVMLKKEEEVVLDFTDSNV